MEGRTRPVGPPAPAPAARSAGSVPTVLVRRPGIFGWRYRRAHPEGRRCRFENVGTDPTHTTFQVDRNSQRKLKADDDIVTLVGGARPRDETEAYVVPWEGVSQDA